MQKFLLPVCWLLALMSVFVLSASLMDKSLHFFGIAGEREQTISFQYPVEIIQVFVAEGENVGQGELMLEVRRHELKSSLTMLEQEIRGYELQKQEASNAIDSQLAGLNAKKQAISADMDAQIHALELRLKVNTEMMQRFSGFLNGANNIPESPELQDLKRKRHFLIQGIQVEIDHLNEQKNATNRPIDMQVNALVQRKEELQRQTVGLKVNAQFDGRIGSVHFKTGELVSPYLPILSLQSRIPRHIKGYIHENVVNDVKLGQQVWVQSIALNQDARPLHGRVVSLGNRIVEYPARLKKNPLVQAWGREVLVRLDSLEHRLLFGEKVQVFLENPEKSGWEFNMNSKANAQGLDDFEAQSALKISSSHAKIPADKIEASGLLWLETEAHYLLIGDEQYRKQAGIFVMQEGGVVSEHLSLGTAKKSEIDDLESISSDGEYIYILSSLSHNKKDKLKANRKKLLRFKYQNQRATEQQSVDLYAQFKKLKKQTTDTQLAAFLKQAIKQHSLDIESHFIMDDALYLGFKSPFIASDKTLIMKINSISALFRGETLSAEIWRSLRLLDPETGEPMLLSDMIQVDGQLLLLSVSRSSLASSVLWRYQSEQGILSAMQIFPGLKAEGIAFQPGKSILTVVFDAGGKKHSKYLNIAFPDSP
ncbi:hypothetical protein [Methyloprofundus sp.]|uniref:hypothetical protein n=1 Tax=Methyloprofundus sp. TaxID=2020875 RepID=UPI003D0F237E